MFNTIYNLLTGPLTWLAFAVLFAGALVRFVSMYNKGQKKDRSSTEYIKLGYGIKSISKWLNPVGTLGWRTTPLVAAVTFPFHICLIVTPLFLSAHGVLWEQYLGITIPELPDTLADIMTLVVIAGGCFFAYRRKTDKTVAFVTQAKDWYTLAIVVAPFITGFLAYHGVAYDIMIILHIASGLLWLAMLPFGRLSHAVLWWYSRTYISSEFQGVRKSYDW